MRMLNRHAIASATLCLSAAMAAGPAPARPVDIYPSREPAFLQSLNGDWTFKYIAGGSAGADAGFYQPGFDTGSWSTIAVPSNWELAGHAEPKYALALQEGLGLYRRQFRVPASWQGRRVLLRFEGVAYGFDVWVNGKTVGASSASAYNPHTFDITDALAEGDGAQTLALKVRTKPLGYEFDVNDDWTLSGIFRDVRLFSVPATHVQDLSTTTTLDGNGAATLSVAVALNAPGTTATGELMAPNGRMVATFPLARAGGNRLAARLRVARPQLWSAESPSLYRLRVTVKQRGRALQTLDERIGLREVKIVNGVLELNGKPIKLRGVNHHDLDSLHGRAITEEQMRQDLDLMKKANINFVRTSHYPPQARFIELCDEQGFYVMDEVSIGKGEEHLEKPSHRDTILARTKATIARDKNRPSVMIWSIGNENDVTEVEMEASRIARQMDPSRPVTLPKVGTYLLDNHTRIPPLVDIHAPHYLNNAQLAKLAGFTTRPVILTEYAHALGLSTDRIQDQWEFIQANPRFAGGAIWHFHDQGLLRTAGKPVDTSQPTDFVWLDSRRYYDTNRNDGTDGIVYADRRPQTDYWETRKVYAPIQVAESSANVQAGAQAVWLTVENRYDFRDLKDSRLEWTLQRNGQAVQSGTSPLSAPPRGREQLQIPVTIPLDAAGDVLALQVRCLDRDGMQVNERVLRLDLEGVRLATALDARADGTPLEVTDDARVVRVVGTHGVLSVTRTDGSLTLHDGMGRLLVAELVPHSGRKMTMSDRSSARATGLWRLPTLPVLESPQVRVSRKDGSVILNVDGRYPRPDAHEQAWTGGYELKIAPSGSIEVRYAFTPARAAGTVTEAGLSVVLPAHYAEFRWLGQGPYAGYPGKDRLNEYGLYHLERSDLRFQGNRRDTTLALLTDAQGTGVAVGMKPGDVAVERQGETTLLSHNALVASPGNKGWVPETQISLERTARIEGQFTLTPLTRQWPARLLRWFGQPAAATAIERPYYHSYDQ